MTTLLKIQSSLSGDAGESSRLATRYAEAWLAGHPDGRVLARDLSREPVPHAIAGESDALVDELRAADVLVIAAPMHNFSVPSTLRAYFDHVARAGVTFRYTASGPQGLLHGKRAVVIATRGGFYPGVADLQVPYIRQFLGFIGITDVEVVVAEGLAIDARSRELALQAARDSLETLARDGRHTRVPLAAARPVGAVADSVAA